MGKLETKATLSKKNKKTQEIKHRMKTNKAIKKYSES